MKVLKAILDLLLSIAIAVGVWFLGRKFGSSIPGREIWYAGFAIGLLVLLAGSLVLGFLWLRKQKKLNVRQVLDLRDERIARMGANRAGETRRFYLAQGIALGYFVMLELLSLGLLFFLGATRESAGGFWMLMPVYLLDAAISRLHRKKQYPDFTKALPEQDFPELYALARNAAGEHLLGKQFHIFVTDNIPDEECNMGIAQLDKHIWITAGTVLLGTLSQEELRQGLQHEFAHISNDDNRELTRYNRLLEFLHGSEDNFMDSLTAFALVFPSAYLAFEGSLYLMLSSVGKEEAADRLASEGADAVTTASALAKIAAHDLYIYERFPYECVFASEEVPQSFATDRLMAYRRALQERQNQWREIMEKELPAKVASHPTFRQRWEALGCCDYDMNPADLDCPYGAECLAAAAVADRMRADIPKEQYDQLRQANYLSAKKIVDEYEMREWTLTPEELRQPMEAYFTCGMPEKMEAICDRIIAEHDSMQATANARYWKGLLLLRRYDAAGLQLIYDAMENNRNYIEGGADEIGKFCTMMGMERELEEYRSRIPELMQEKMDWTSNGITAKADLSPETLPEGWLEKIVAYILSGNGEKVNKIYLVHETVKNGAYSAFVLQYADTATEEERSDIYDKTFRLLDGWPEEWEFYLYDYEFSMEKVLLKVPGSCVFDREKNK